MTKSINYGNSKYAKIVSDATANVPILIAQTTLPLPLVTEDFFATVSNEIVFSKKGYVNITLKGALTIPASGTVDLQVFKDGVGVVNGRERFRSPTTIEFSFGLEVDINSFVRIETLCTINGTAFEYLPPSGSMLEQKPYILTLEFIPEDFTDIGTVIEHTRADLNVSDSRYIPLDTADGVILDIALYPRLYAALTGTQYLDPTFTDPGKFKVVSCLNYPYIRGGNIVFAETELPSLDLVLGSADAGHSHAAGTLTTGDAATRLGAFKFRDSDNTRNLYVSEASDDFQAERTDNNQYLSITTEVEHGSAENTIALYDRVRAVTGSTASSNATHNHSITVNPIYQGGTNLQPPAIGVYRYLIGDSQ